MGFFDRWRSPETSFVAAANVIDVADKKEAAAQAKRREEWQAKAFDNYDQIPELWFAFNFIANALRRVRIYPARQVDSSEPPVPLDPATDGSLAIRAQQELDKLRSFDGTHGEIIHDLAMQLSIPGEGYLLGRPPRVDDGVPIPEEWGVYSIDELRYDNGSQQWRLYEGPGSTDFEELPPTPETFVSRLHRPHPRFKKRADSGMRAVLDECDELQTLQRLSRSQARSRIPAGLLLFPSEAKFKKPPGQAVGGQAAVADPLVSDVLNALITPIQDEMSAAAVVPPIISMKGDFIEKVKHLIFARPFDEESANRMDVLLHRVITAVDLPNDVVFGLGELTHWNAWQVSEDSFDSHLAPLLTLIVSGLTGGFLRPQMNDVPDNDVIVWFDASALIAHPNKGADADKALELGGIGYDAFRRYKGYTKDDAPTPEDLAQIEKLVGAGRSANSSSAGPPTTGASVTASANPHVGRELGAQLRYVDHELRTKLLTASQATVFKAVEKTGAKLRRRVGEKGPHAAAIKDVPNARVGLTLGWDAAAGYFDAGDQPLDSEVAALSPLFTKWTSIAQKRVRDLAASASPDRIDEVNLDELVRRQEESRITGASLLTAGLALVLTNALFSPTTVSQHGEFDGSLLVPPGLVRDALIVAGGGTEGGVMNASTGQPQGEVATGVDALDLFAQLNLTPDAWEWSYGDPGSRGTVFEGHFDLDGVQFLDWQDDLLTVQDQDAWLGEDRYFPGDHLYCQCDFIPVLTEEGA